MVLSSCLLTRGPTGSPTCLCSPSGVSEATSQASGPHQFCGPAQVGLELGLIQPYAGKEGPRHHPLGSLTSAPTLGQ